MSPGRPAALRATVLKIWRIRPALCGIGGRWRREDGREGGADLVETGGTEGLLAGTYTARS